MKWQDRVKQLVRASLLTITSGYRTPEHNAEIGGAKNSWHTKGTVQYPGAYDVAGGRFALTDLFTLLADEYQGHINELFLNIEPGWQAIKKDKPLKKNPEGGRPQHLHIALRDKE